MLTFFRRIRKGLLEGGATSKYLLYAIGEIALVVIGILIALQINNWNEWRKDRAKEKEVLSDLVENLELNIIELDRVIESGTSLNTSKRKVISALESKSPYSDSLGFHFLVSAIALPESTLSESGYEMLKNQGFDILTTKTLAKEIVQLFEITYKAHEKREKSANVIYLIEDMTRYYRRFFKLSYNPTRRIPIDYPALNNDNYFIEGMKAIVSYTDLLIRRSWETLSETKRVLQLIKDELGESD